MASPQSVPRTLPDPSFSSLHTSSRTSPSSQSYDRSPSQHPNGPPISPPKTRSASADETSAALIEDWRVYTQNLRSQSEGERAHMSADRARMEEVMAEERALWDREREYLKARIAELEALLQRQSGNQSGTHVPLRQSYSHTGGHQAIGYTSPGSNAVSVTGSIDSNTRSVPQETGRNADGTPFYAPAPQNPSRTFDTSETSELRVDDIVNPRDSAIRVTSHELKSSDFGIQSPQTGRSQDLETIQETPHETIDISYIQPELEGVAIKASAVSPTFVAKVLTPMYSPPKLSPSTKPAGRDVSPNGGSRAQRTLEVVSSPVDKRLTMHAGHTPNHSMSKFDFLGGSGGEQTPTQEHHEPPAIFDGPADSQTTDSPGDKELTGPLSLPNNAVADDPFLTQLVEKLSEAKKSEGTSPASEVGSQTSREGDEEEDDGPVLKLKPSRNFGKPLGSM